ncbi:LacI family DNA-binding transcriptional regulator [Streptomyces sp. NPDC057620]|uniref:LacI family DNA-binding transcriptional regulator n=1 Tax=Streptomyces liliiviolaceus TaxID=2823109 RepID=A0A940Y529_9ACTN|nr:LacI family DNA-binding transcriptional regulator [Streptomyces liliiviolaceus]MBQ0854718.1 LacI family DNA-binding transcriptional regulator [Streptomyces liliiviolaceus]
MATIKDVAARAGVALGTASRVLSGSSQTSADSRSRVLAAAAELGYIANGPARSLRRARTDVLGLLVSDIRNPFFSELAHAAEQEARHHGYTVLLANANEDAEQADAYLQTFAGQRIDGLLFSPQSTVSPQLAATLASGLPLVFLNRRIEGVDAPLYGTDNAQGVEQVLAWLRSRGHHDVAFVGGPDTISTGAERRAAYLAGRQAHGINTDERLLDAGDFLAGGAAEAMSRILDHDVPFTAVFGANGLTTLGVVRALRERLGAERAARIEIVSFDDLDWFEFASPPISAVRNDASSIGRLGVRGLVDLIAGRPAPGRRVPTTFADRALPAVR